jgi:hypothetical protein
LSQISGSSTNLWKFKCGRSAGVLQYKFGVHICGISTKYLEVPLPKNSLMKLEKKTQKSIIYTSTKIMKFFKTPFLIHVKVLPTDSAKKSHSFTKNFEISL